MLETLKTILIYGGSFLAVLGVVVVVHELGHFQVARWCGVAVKSFSFGMGPAVLSTKDKHGTTWKVSAVPIGGFVSWFDDADALGVRASDEAQKISDDEARQRGYFRAQPVWARAAVVAAGPLTNFLFAILAFAALILIIGRDVASVHAVLPDSAAARAGLQAGDVIRSVDGQRVETFQRLQTFVIAAPERRLLLGVDRGGQEIVVPITPQARVIGEGANAQRVGMLGVEHTPAPFGQRERVGPVESLRYGADQTWTIITLTGSYVVDIFRGRQSANNLAGPLGILDKSGQITNAAISQPDVPLGLMLAQLGLSLLEWAAILSVAVGIANLLPVPILDGGQLVFYAIEAVRGGKPLPVNAQEWAFRAGIAVMGALFLFATWNDIQRLLG